MFPPRCNWLDRAMSAVGGVENTTGTVKKGGQLRSPKPGYATPEARPSDRKVAGTSGKDVCVLVVVSLSTASPKTWRT